MEISKNEINIKYMIFIRIGNCFKCICKLKGNLKCFRKGLFILLYNYYM